VPQWSFAQVVAGLSVREEMVGPGGYGQACKAIRASRGANGGVGSHSGCAWGSSPGGFGDCCHWPLLGSPWFPGLAGRDAHAAGYAGP
jgi:hypothetical protein